MKTYDKVAGIARRAKAEPKTKFTSLAHLLDEQMLRHCFGKLHRGRAVGVDGVSIEDYGRNLDANLSSLVGSLKAKTWRPQPVRRVHIPKPGKDETRPLGIPTTEDKIVQMGLKTVLEGIFEQDFLPCSHGFRPGRSPHTALKSLRDELNRSSTRFVVEVDIRKFFDNVSHYWLQRCLEERISDPNVLLLVRRFLRCGVMQDGVVTGSEVGTPQGGVVSPLLANIYLHYILDLWFERVFRKSRPRAMALVRYCDDFVATFESRKDAEAFLSTLKERLAKFGLEMAEEKTRLLAFGLSPAARDASLGRKTETFTFLGFTFYMGKTRKGSLRPMVKTSKEKLRRVVKGMSEYLRERRNVALEGWYPIFLSKLRGHLNYFGVSGNMRHLRKVLCHSRNRLFYWLNRRSQKKSFTQEAFEKFLVRHPLPEARIVHRLYSAPRPV